MKKEHEGKIKSHSVHHEKGKAKAHHFPHADEKEDKRLFDSLIKEKVKKDSLK